MYVNLQQKGQFIQGTIVLLNSMGIENAEAIRTNLWDNPKYEEAMDIALKCKEKYNELVNFANENYKPSESWGLEDNDFYKNVYPLMVSVGELGDRSNIALNQRLRTSAYTPEGRKMLCLRAMVTMLQANPVFEGKNDIENINYYAQNLVPLEMAKNVDAILKEAKELGIDKENEQIFKFISDNKESYKSASRFTNLKDIYSSPESIAFFALEGKELDKTQAEKLTNYQPEATKAFLENQKAKVPTFPWAASKVIADSVKPGDVEIQETKDKHVGVLTGRYFKTSISERFEKIAVRNVKRAAFDALKIMRDVDEWYVPSSEQFGDLKKELKKIIKRGYRDIDANPAAQIEKLTEMAKAYLDKKATKTSFNARETSRLNAMQKVYATLKNAKDALKEIRNCTKENDAAIEKSMKVSSKSEQFSEFQKVMEKRGMNDPAVKAFIEKAVPAIDSVERDILKSAVTVNTPEFREKVAYVLLSSSLMEEYSVNKAAFQQANGKRAVCEGRYPGEYKFYDMICKEGAQKAIDGFKNSPLMDFIIKKDKIKNLIREHKSVMKEFEEYKSEMKVDGSVDNYTTYKMKLNLSETATYDQVKALAKKEYIKHHPDKVHSDDPMVRAEHAKAFEEGQKMYEDLTKNEEFYREIDKTGKANVNVEAKPTVVAPQLEAPKIAGL